MSRFLLFLSLSLFLLVLPACRDSAPAPDDHAHAEGEADHPHAEAEEAEGWAVTAWSEHYELFAETDPLIAGREAPSHAHFTYLPDFSALNEGSVTGILRGANGFEESFHAPKPLRAGIFNVVFKPSREGTYDLVFAVRNSKASEEIPAGRVRVGAAASPGNLVELPPGAPDEEAAAGEPVGFLKEQQWRTEFATEWAREGALKRALRAPGRVLPAGGSEAILTAPVDGVVTAASWPHPGLDVGRGAPLFVLTPRVSADQSVAGLRADVTELEAELGTAKARLGRLQELLKVEAASRRDVEEADARVKGLTARLDAARRDRAAASAIRSGGGAGPESFRIASPLAGRVAEVAVSPGQFVSAGTSLGRVVRTSPVWVELALQPDQAAFLVQVPAGLSVRRWAGEEPFLIPGEDLRLVARSPEVQAGTGTVPVILEVRRGVDLLRLGSRIEAEVLLPQDLPGIVIPASSLVDDSGVEVIYVQLSGESFDRREVRIEARQGPRTLVRGITPGERIVTKGGNAIRRSSLLGSGAVEGHVH
ncbi:MAG TPA: efflux RND transporter periplasmic adaptor subunit [Thermoanaerobaculia bacterium]|nr:efflux RND transporter periplasmic adaptor subunit [Thermoanaerobaculia bacterium]